MKFYHKRMMDLTRTFHLICDLFGMLLRRSLYFRKLALIERLQQRLRYFGFWLDFYLTFKLMPPAFNNCNKNWTMQTTETHKMYSKVPPSPRYKTRDHRATFISCGQIYCMRACNIIANKALTAFDVWSSRKTSNSHSSREIHCKQFELVTRRNRLK